MPKVKYLINNLKILIRFSHVVSYILRYAQSMQEFNAQRAKKKSNQMTIYALFQTSTLWSEGFRINGVQPFIL